MDERPRFGAGARLAQALAACVARQTEGLRGHADLAGFVDEPGLSARLRDDAPAARALAALAGALSLDAAEHLACRLALQVEIDIHFGAALSVLQGSDQESGPQRPTLGLLAALVSVAAEPATDPGGDDLPARQGRAMGRLLQGQAAACGLLQMAEAGPLALRTVALPAALSAMLMTGEMAARATLGTLRLRALPAPDWSLPASWCAALAPTPLLAGAAQLVVLRGPADAPELCAAAQALAVQSGLRAVQIDGDGDELMPATLLSQAVREGLAPCLRAAGAAAVWRAPAGLGRPLRVPRLAGFDGPWIVLADADTAVQADATMAVVEIELPLPGPAERVALWRSFGDSGAAGAAELATELSAIRESRCGVGVLLRAARQAATRGDTPPAALRQAVRAAARDLSAWAQVSHDRVPVDAWVGQDELQRELGLLLARCAARDDAARGLGPLLAGRTPAGVKALFVGASGTGKTLAAQWIADRLARPLVRVDLGAVVSKYIGETEKNLGALLTRAEHVDAVLLFDEADSLFGARTDVRQANDRYANMQTNYLLQRLETFRGLALLTSNSRARFDDAFVRRLDATIEFPLPDAAQRHRLWSLHLGDGAAAAEALRGLRDRIAALADLPGGHIRNAALTAALLSRQRLQPAGAATPGDDTLPPIEAADLVEAIAIEYRKLGQRMPDALRLP